MSGVDLSEVEFEEITAKADTMSLGNEVIRKGEQYFVGSFGNAQVRLSLNEYEVKVLGLRDVSTAERKSLAKKGRTFKGQSYPIANCGDLKNARQAVGRARPQDRSSLKSYLNGLNRKMSCGLEPL